MYPASTAALDAPIAAPSLSAISVINLKLSPLCIPLPPDTTILAVPSSGRSDLISSLLINFVFENSSLASTFSIGADPPVLSHGSKEVGLIVTHFLASLLLIVAKMIKAPFFFVAVGSQANIGGAASAPVVASAFHPSLAAVGVLLAVLGYAVGTYAAYLCGIIMQNLV